MMNRLFVSALILAGLVIPAGAANLVKTYSYFSVGGRTLEEIEKELSKRGPQVKTTGNRHPGATRMVFTSRIGYGEQGGSCRIMAATVTVKTHVILPRWRQRARADAETRVFWDTLSSDIKRHEESHVVIAKNHARELEDALKASAAQKTCAQATAKAKEITAKILEKHDQAQLQFDRVEGVNFERRILRLLRYRMERIDNGRLPG